MARLGDLIEQIRGVSYKPEDVYNELNKNSVALLRANNIKDGQLNFDDVIYVDKKRVRDNQLLKAGDILICTSSGSKELVGKAAYIYKDLPMTFGAFCKVVRPQKINPKYLGHFFDSPYYRQKISDSSAGANINNIRNEHIDELDILVPAVEKQQYISSVLDKVNSLISLRKQQLATLDELVKARFVEMFGDISFNTNGYPMVKLGDIAFITKLAGFEYTEHIHYKDHGDIIMVRGLNCKKTKLVLDDIYWIDQTTSDILPRSKLFAGDILMTYVGTVGEVALIDADNRYHLAPNVAKISLNDKKAHVPEFFVYMFMYCRDYIMKHASTTTQAALSMGKIRDIAFPIPPTDLQIQFSIFIKQVSGMQLTIQQSLDKMEVLKKSLMQEYFG